MRANHPVEQVMVPAGRYTSRFRAELAVLDAALCHLEAGADEWRPREVRVCTDSKSALTRLAGGPHAQSDTLVGSVWNHLSTLASRDIHIILQWVPGHAGLPGNELADEVARGAAALDQGTTRLDLNSAKSCLKRHAHSLWSNKISTTRYAEENGTKRVLLGDKYGLSRLESVEVARLRTGHSLLLRSYLHRVGLAPDGTCPECEEEEETPKHLLNECPARMLLRREVFGRDDPTVREALEDPPRLAAFIRRLGRL